MKARVKATGEIVHVGDYNTIYHDPMYKNERTGPWRLEELDFAEAPDYWTRLEHQAAIAAMQAQMAPNCLDSPEGVACTAYAYAHTLVEKMKEKEERK